MISPSVEADSHAQALLELEKDLQTTARAARELHRRLNEQLVRMRNMVQEPVQACAAWPSLLTVADSCEAEAKAVKRRYWKHVSELAELWLHGQTEQP